MPPTALREASYQKLPMNRAQLYNILIMTNQNFSMKSPLLGVRVLVKMLGGHNADLFLIRHSAVLPMLAGHIGSTGKLVRHLGSMVATRKLAQLSSSYSSIASALRLEGHMDSHTSVFPAVQPLYPLMWVIRFSNFKKIERMPRFFLKTKTGAYRVSSAPTMVSSVSSCSNATFSMGNSHVYVKSPSKSPFSHVQSLRHFCTSSDSDQEEIFIDQESSLIEELCDKISSFYSSYQKLSLFPSLRPFDIAEIRRLVLRGNYHFSSLEILSSPKDQYLTSYLSKLDPDYPDVHTRYNASENLVYVIKPTSPEDCLVFLALAKTLYSFIHGFLYDVRMHTLHYLLKVPARRIEEREVPGSPRGVLHVPFAGFSRYGSLPWC